MMADRVERRSSAPSEVLDTWLEKKYFSSCRCHAGWCMNFLRGDAREMVDCAGIHRLGNVVQDQGFITRRRSVEVAALMPTICVATFISVSLRLCRLLINQRALQLVAQMKVLSALESARFIVPAWLALTRRRGIASGSARPASARCAYAR